MGTQHQVRLLQGPGSQELKLPGEEGPTGGAHGQAEMQATLLKPEG